MCNFWAGVYKFQGDYISLASQTNLRSLNQFEMKGMLYLTVFDGASLYSKSCNPVHVWREINSVI